ncbi:MAG TPA: DPP IV N-terminal domain-containing protein, partial [Pyrinomonadaceae bacterium]|nr:DPP IV N-terminal domain-containing protein [Pyrinomonadaceae bacterium]
MKRSFPLLVVLLVLTTAALAQKALTSFDYDRAVQRLSFSTDQLVDRNGVRATWLPDGRFYYRALTPLASEYVVVDPKTGSRKAAPTLAELGISAAAATGGGFQSNGGATSPDGTKTAFIRDFNLWVKDNATGKETQLTKDGEKNFGYATDNAGWRHTNNPVILWSPDSKKIATFQDDERNVSDVYLVPVTVGAPKLQTWKSALPGDANVPMIHRVIIDASTGDVTRLKVDPDPHRSSQCDDILCDGWSDVYWAPDGKTLAFLSTSRDHKNEKLRVADVATGSVREVYEESTKTQFESGQGQVNWQYLPDSNEFVWFTERDGWGHLYLYDLATGKLKNQITKGDWAVWQVLKTDTANRVIYGLGGGIDKSVNPYFGQVFRVNFDGSGFKVLTPEAANHNIEFSADGRYFIDNFSTPDTPVTAVLRDTAGKLVASLEKGDVTRLKAAGWQPPVQFTVKAHDGVTDLYGLLYLPTNVDKKKKYPIIDNIYPGPQGGAINSGGPTGRNFSSARGDNEALAELGFVVVQLDGMCNPLRSKAFHDSCYGNMADNTLEDQIAGIKQLAQKYPFIDLDRVGIWGHSGGGFATAAAMFRYPDFFKVGISESGNHDNRNYEDDWGERYIGLLTKDASGKSNYEDQANQNFAKNLKGHLMLAHGTMDDNVPPSNTLLVVDALIKANKDFDLVMIPNARHGYGAASYYMM